MSNFQSNPYASAPVSSAPKPDHLSSNIKMPGTLKAVAILMIILGSLGLVGAAFGVLGAIAQMFVPQPTGEQADMQRQINEIASKYNIAQYVVMGINAVVSFAFLVGGIFALKGKALARTFILVGVVLGIICELARAVLTYLATTAMFPAIDSMVAEQPGVDGDTFRSIMTVSIIAGVIIGIVWALIKIVLYVWFVLTSSSTKSKSFLQG